MRLGRVKRSSSCGSWNAQATSKALLFRSRFHRTGYAGVMKGQPLTLSEEEVAFGKVAHFGNWLRLNGRLPDGASMRAIVALNLKA